MNTLRTLLAAPLVALVYIALATMLTAGWLALKIGGKK